ncbi:bifunctional phosphopantothenoylcysteine decarboxylase/phosphopantothenate--cysteine ligase CoaBC [Cohaesibacter sp. CAU 1516]|uniref:bifunctional phosphopantothenoylcysteine decarboxylase/phosphopantothenate--cysteine ligase CoaBC n=1 Tax=Cohaesibacter sp. CAU 1516 TaxID=2576038 RepID=UPI0010FDDB00|nr:bifunctional phosphopantothenoylcysteine decarboxylase/phosphopantothenate--cysteine ligase CoaBC [Cohaesibacter sp. CAU 1516]TLP47157.1 bifunctional phosphopantothenoylcysteine decarboxylase/phosphopantothenate--cysteine ligase CoaBC [Cohaesibacter sp. CAU 1516]
MLANKRILLIISSSVAAFKATDIARLLIKQGASVKVILTRNATEFVSPLTLAALTGEAAITELFDLTREQEIGHIELSRDADLVVVAPCTANLMAKMAHGIADDLASTTLLATDKEVLVAPAMNVRMWQHPATQRNLAQLKADGIHFVGPDVGMMACNEEGPGRLAEPDAIIEAIDALLAEHDKPLSGKHVLITAGPTHEPIDPVRYIANRSSGKQGYALAAAARAAGADVTLVSGPVNLDPPAGVTCIKVETAQQMHDAVSDHLPSDVAIMAAAVADWKVANQGTEKIKKKPDGSLPELHFSENPDIARFVGTHPSQRPTLVVGFAAETQNLETNAGAKLKKKGVDWIIANDVSPETGIMGGDRNSVKIVRVDGIEAWPDMEKGDVAKRLIERIAQALDGMAQV